MSFDAFSWTPVDAGAMFAGNVGPGENISQGNFSAAVSARYVRIEPVAWINHISMRAGVYVELCGAEAAAVEAHAAACVVRESYDNSAVSFSSMIAAGADHPQLDNALTRPCWAAATKDLNQVSPRTLPPLFQ